MLSDLYDGLPGCAVSCVQQGLADTACAVVNMTSTCLCKDSLFIEAYRDCVRSLCDTPNILIAKNVTWTCCGYPYANQTGSLAGRIVIVTVTAMVFVARQIAKCMRLSAWGADDVSLIIGYLFTLAFAITKFYGAQWGIGQDIWALSHQEITKFMQVFFAFEVIYTLSIGALKASILFFYMRVFSLVNPVFTAVLWSTQAFNIINCIAFTIANLNQCKPFSYAWEGWDGRHKGYCVNLGALLISHAAVNIVLDVWMLLLPLTQVLWLNLRKRQKLEILSMFGLGVFITLVSIIRLKVLLSFRNFSDPTYDAFYLHMWSYIELSVGVIVACLPSTRQLWRDLVPKLKTKLGFGAPSSRPRQPGESARRLKAILFLSGSRPAPGPSKSATFMSSPSTRTRSGGLEEDASGSQQQ